MGRARAPAGLTREPEVALLASGGSLYTVKDSKHIKIGLFIES
jgi:hypothetical protein